MIDYELHCISTCDEQNHSKLVNSFDNSTGVRSILLANQLPPDRMEVGRGNRKLKTHGEDDSN